MRLLTPILAAVVLATPGAAGAGAQASPAREDCGKYSSASVYPKAKVIAVRGVQCGEARKVAKRYDHTGEPRGKWSCALGHGGRRLFSCGYGGYGGNLADSPHALIAKGVGPPVAMAGGRRG